MLEIHFDEKSDLDYFLSREADHFYLCLYHVKRLDEHTITLDENFYSLAKNNLHMFSIPKWDEKDMKKKIMVKMKGYQIKHISE